MPPLTPLCALEAQAAQADAVERSAVLETALRAAASMRPDVALLLWPLPERTWRPHRPDSGVWRLAAAERAWHGGGGVAQPLAAEPPGPERAWLQERGVGHLLCLPCAPGDRDGGVLLLGRRDTPFSAAEVEAGHALAALAEAALRQVADRRARELGDAHLQALLALLPDPAWLCLPDGQILYANPAARTLHRRMGHGVEPEQRRLGDLLGMDPGLIPAALRAPGQSFSGQARGCGPAGEFLLAYAAAPVRLGGGRSVGGVVLGRDLSAEERRRQEGLRQERLAALGQLAAGAAHEIRNPLTAVRGFLQLVASQVRSEPQAHYLQIVRQEMERIERITADLLLLSRSWKVRLTPCDVGGVLDAVAELVRPRALERAIAVEVATAPDLPRVAADRERLEQVFLNLAGNAIEAVRGPGRVELSARLDPAGFVEVAVADDGPGIPAAALPRLFEPFFTTKAGGTGLGLAVSEAIVRSFGGHISVSSPEGAGAVFRVRLPAAVP